VPDFLALRQAPIEDAAQDTRTHEHMAPEHEVIEHAQAAEQRDVLERARHAQRCDRARALAGDIAAFQRDASAVRPVETGYHVEQRRLAGAVGTNDGENAALWNVDRYAIDCDNAAEPLGRTLDRHLHSRRCDAIGTLGNIHAHCPCAWAVRRRRPMSSRSARMDEPSQVPTARPCNG
jgi:hypothetical protein